MSTLMLGEAPVLLRNVRFGSASSRFLPDAGTFDVLLRDGMIADIAPSGNLTPTGASFDTAGLWAIPGLWDHHVHSVPWALYASRVPLLECSSAAEAAAVMGAALPDGNGIRVGVGFRDGLWPDVPSLELLDRATGTVPTYCVNADLHSVWCNSAALARSQRAAEDGVLREAAAFAVCAELDASAGDQIEAAVAAAAQRAAARGVVGIVDLDMAWNVGAWQRRAEAGFDRLRVAAGIYPVDLQRAIEAGLQSGASLDEQGLITVGPLKVITDGSLGTGTAACRHPYADAGPHERGMLTVPEAELRELMTRATAAGLSLAVHAIGDLAVGNALDAYAVTGASGTIEHAQLVDAVDIVRFGRLGVGASLQPSHAVDDRDLVDGMWQHQRGIAYPMRSLMDAGATVLFGSDAPVARLDPWRGIAAAVMRTDDERAPWHPHERVTRTQAIAASTAGGTASGAALVPGMPADLALCAEDPETAAAEVLTTMSVAATLVGGRITHLG